MRITVEVRITVRATNMLGRGGGIGEAATLLSTEFGTQNHSALEHIDWSQPLRRSVIVSPITIDTVWL